MPQYINCIKHSCKELFLVFDGRPTRHWRGLGSFVMTLTIVAIILGLISAVMSTDPTQMSSPPYCTNPVCSNEPLCPNTMICKPVPRFVFSILNGCVTSVFITDYLVRFCTVWACTSREADLIPDSWYDRHKPGDRFPVYSWYRHYYYFIFSFRNMIDLAAILPYLIATIQASNSIGANVVRILRLVRLLGLLNRHQMVKLMLSVVVTTIRKSGYALGVLFLISIIGVIFFASIIFAFEQGEFRVTEAYPDGIFMRRGWVGNKVQYVPTPFNSLGTTIYFVITTITTVGYGDLTPVTKGGRATANLTMYCGVIMLALPVGVISSTFNEVYHKTLNELEAKQQLRIENDELLTYWDEHHEFDIIPDDMEDNRSSLGTKDVPFVAEIDLENPVKLELRSNISSKSSFKDGSSSTRIVSQSGRSDPSKYVSLALEYARTGKPRTVPDSQYELDGF